MSGRMYRFALAGNPNSGKTTLFNELTGSTQYTGNWPGVTIEKKEGRVRRSKEDIRIIDLPGIYSLSPYSMEEILARDYIINDRPDLIINIVDATNLERNLYLTTQLLELDVPVLIALNMMDAVAAKGDKIDCKRLSEEIDVPVIPISASKGEGIQELMAEAEQIIRNLDNDTGKHSQNSKLVVFDKEIEKYISEIKALLLDMNISDSKASAMRSAPGTPSASTSSDVSAEMAVSASSAAAAATAVSAAPANKKSANKTGTAKEAIPAADISWLAVKLLEGDKIVSEKLKLSSEIYDRIGSYKKALESMYENDIESIIADGRYNYITAVVKKAVKKKNSGTGLTISDKIDKVVTNRIIAIPLFIGIMLATFKITFGFIGSYLADVLDNLINVTIAGFLTDSLNAAGASDLILDLVVNGIIGGVGSILVFIPQFVILFLLLSILEDSGYMARAAFVMDRLLRKLGLSGKSFIPMLIGFGCSVPAIMSTRTLENEKDRRLTIILAPFMSCGARLPIYLMFTAAFFSENQDVVILSIYLLGIVAAILSGLLLKKTIFKGDSAPFVMELPPYRIPTFKGLMIHLWDRTGGFLKKAGTVIFAASAIVWALQTFNFSFQLVENPGDSILGKLGSLIAPIFAPLGFGDWKSAVALITGFIAKESVVSTMGILHGAGEITETTAVLNSALQAVYTPLTAYAFMAFALLYLPCMAAFATIKREMNSWKWTLFTVGYQTVTAWIVAFIIFRVGSLLT